MHLQNISVYFTLFFNYKNPYYKLEWSTSWHKKIPYKNKVYLTANFVYLVLGDWVYASNCHASRVRSNNVAFNDGMMDLPNTSSCHRLLVFPCTKMPIWELLTYSRQFRTCFNIIHICWRKSNISQRTVDTWSDDTFQAAHIKHAWAAKQFRNANGKNISLPR